MIDYVVYLHADLQEVEIWNVVCRIDKLYSSELSWVFFEFSNSSRIVFLTSSYVKVEVVFKKCSRNSIDDGKFQAQR